MAAGTVGIAGLDVAQVVEQAETVVQEPIISRDQEGSRAAGRVAQGHTVQPGQHRPQETAVGRSGAAQVNAMILGEVGAGLLPERIERGRDQIVDDVIGRVVDPLFLASSRLPSAVGQGCGVLVQALRLELLDVGDAPLEDPAQDVNRHLVAIVELAHHDEYLGPFRAI